MRWAHPPSGWHSAFGKLLASALVVASLVHFFGGWLLPLETPSRMVISLISAQLIGGSEPGADLSDRLLVLKLDRATFRGRNRYNGIQPLDRCKLKDDLRDLLAATPALERLALDIDLSDTRIPSMDACTDDILAMFSEAQARRKDAGAPGLQVFLILPVDTQDRAESQAWRDRVRARGVYLADPRLLQEFGVVRRHSVDMDHCPSLGVALSGKATPASLETCFDVRQDLDEIEASPEHDHNIAFQQLGHRLAVPQLDPATHQAYGLHQQLGRAGMASVRVALLGTDFDRTDTFRTPIGELSGAEVHAAVALEPFEGISHRLGFALDVALGLAMGALVHKFWTAYFSQRLAAPGARAVGPADWAYLWLLLLGAGWLLAGLLLLPVASVGLLVLFGLWVSPVPMLVGMTLDAFIVGSASVAVHRMEHKAATAPGDSPAASSTPPAPSPAPAPPQGVGFWGGLLAMLPLACGLLLVGWTLVAIYGASHG